MAKHLRFVLRVEPGDTIRTGLVNGPRGEGTVVRINSERIDLTVRWDQTAVRDATIPVDVLLGHPRPPVLTRLWRDLSAIGVARIIVFSAVLTERSYMSSTVWRDSRRYLIDGLSQGMHTALPQLCRASTLREAIAMVEASHRYVALPRKDAANRFPTVIGTVSQDPRPVALCVGPERGFVETEIESLAAAGFAPVDLGRGILRTETAAVLFAGALAASLGGFVSNSHLDYD